MLVQLTNANYFIFLSFFDDLLFCVMSKLTFPVLTGRCDYIVKLNCAALLLIKKKRKQKHEMSTLSNLPGLIHYPVTWSHSWLLQFMLHFCEQFMPKNVSSQSIYININVKQTSTLKYFFVHLLQVSNANYQLIHSKPPA